MSGVVGPTTAPVLQPPAPTVSFAEALRFWLELGFISFGGPAGQIAIMHTELVERRRWISEQRFLHALNFCMLLPGPQAQQLATCLGGLMHRTWGGIVAGALVVHAAHRIGSRAPKNRWRWAIAAAAFVAIFAPDLPFPAIVLGAALIGHLAARLAPRVFALGGGHGGAQPASHGPAVIDRGRSEAAAPDDPNPYR